jgi:TctA family transporter
MPTLRGTAVGSAIGALPGSGAIVATFMSYALEKRVSDTPEKFGRGAIEGIAAPEAANNAAVQAAFIPTLSLGIPGDALMAVMLGAMMIHGIVPGPQFITEHAATFWGLVASFWIGNVLLLVLNIPLIGVWVRLLSIPYHLLYPAMLFFICIGVYAINNNVFDIATPDSGTRSSGSERRSRSRPRWIWLRTVPGDLRSARAISSAGWPSRISGSRTSR